MGRAGRNANRQEREGSWAKDMRCATVGFQVLCRPNFNLGRGAFRASAVPSPTSTVQYCTLTDHAKIPDFTSRTSVQYRAPYSKLLDKMRLKGYELLYEVLAVGAACQIVPRFPYGCINKGFHGMIARASYLVHCACVKCEETEDDWQKLYSARILYSTVQSCVVVFTRKWTSVPPPKHEYSTGVGIISELNQGKLRGCPFWTTRVTRGEHEPIKIHCSGHRTAVN